jgi:hypothetical protein
MLKNVFFALMFMGCAKRPTLGLNMHDLSEYPGPTFMASNSPCLDGLLVNLGNSCAQPIEIRGTGAIAVVQCHKAKKKTSAWDDYTFFVIGNHKIGAPPETEDFCIDLNTAIYIQERP